MAWLSRLKFFFILHRDSDADVSGAATAIVVVASVKQPEPVQVDDYRLSLRRICHAACYQ
jgi:hypothetical protein